MSHSLRLFAANLSSTLDSGRWSLDYPSFLPSVSLPFSRRSRAARRRIAANFLCLLDGLYFHLLQCTGYQPLFGVQACRNINNLF